MLRARVTRLAVPTSREAKLAWIGRLQPSWQSMVGASDESYPFTLAPVLQPRHVERCRVAPTREDMIQRYLPKGAVVAEVGTDRGHNARTILDGARPRELHLIDVDLSRLERGLLQSAIDDGVVRLHEADSAATLAAFPDGYFDWIYIDGNHTYGGVLRDVEQAKRKVKSDGLLVFNDYTLFSHAELVEYGVIHVVNRLCLDEGWELRYFALESQMYCDAAIARAGVRDAAGVTGRGVRG
jgi:hypothetical protein